MPPPVSLGLREEHRMYLLSVENFNEDKLSVINNFDSCFSTDLTSLI